MTRIQPLSFFFKIGDKTYETIGSFGGESYAYIYNSHIDEYGWKVKGSSGNKSVDVNLFLQGSPSVISSTTLPSTPPDLSSFGTKVFSFQSVDYLNESDYIQTDFVGTLTSLTAANTQPSQPVPEPASALGILAFGAMGGGSLLRRRKKLQSSKA